jgi:hypothetical protein
MNNIQNYFSVKDIKLKYYMFKYLWNNKENVFFILSNNESTAIKSFIKESEKTGFNIDISDILIIQELSLINPN